MYKCFTRRALGAILLLVIGCAVAAATPAIAKQNATGPVHHVHVGANGESDVDACGDANPGQARCLARVRTDDKAKQAKPKPGHGLAVAATTVGNNGAYDPSFLQSAYNAPSASAGAGQTLAIVDAFDNPRAESDLSTYRATYGLSECTTANGCFRKVDQRGGNAFPTTINWGWASEISLDVQMVSAMCPLCHILLVEADSNTYDNLGAAENEAVALGANVVSNSWGGSEFSGETQYDAAYFNHPGVAIVASTGDAGYGTQFPAASPYVTAVGGTSLVQNTNTGTRDGSETVWSGAGSGCSYFEPKPSWQHDSGCGQRTIADVAAVADPNTGVWVYDAYSNSGWMIFGGTSASAPIVASMYALAGPVSSSSPAPSYPYGNGATTLTDVSAGSNGSCGTYLCTGIAAYDGPTGLGTPLGVASFVVPSGSSSTTTTTPPPPPPPTGTVPGAPRSLAAHTASPSGVKLTWKAPSSNGGSAITGYQVWRSTSTGTETNYVNSTCTTSSCTFVDTGTTPNVTYFYKVAAVNTVGVGALSGQSSAKAR